MARASGAGSVFVRFPATQGLAPQPFSHERIEAFCAEGLAQATCATRGTYRSVLRRPPRFAPGLSTTHGGVPTEDPDVSPDQTYPGWLPQFARSPHVIWIPPPTLGARADGHTVELHRHSQSGKQPAANYTQVVLTQALTAAQLAATTRTCAARCAPRS